MSVEIMRVGGEVFQYSIGQVVNFDSAARAMCVVDINYATGAVALEPYRGGRAGGWLRKLWSRLQAMVSA